jgi:hypothetical protein
MAGLLRYLKRLSSSYKTIFFWYVVRSDHAILPTVVGFSNQGCTERRTTSKDRCRKEVRVDPPIAPSCESGARHFRGALGAITD